LSVIHKKDETNGIFPLLPWVREERPAVSSSSLPSVVVKDSLSGTIGGSRSERRRRTILPLPSRRVVGITGEGDSGVGGDGNSSSECHHELSTQGVEMAFNDCVVIHFSSLREVKKRRRRRRMVEDEEDGEGKLMIVRVVVMVVYVVGMM